MSDEEQPVYYAIYEHHTEGRKRTGLANGPFGMIKGASSGWNRFCNQLNR